MVARMRIERSVVVEADVDATWRLVTRPDDLAAWLGREVELDLVPGGAGRVVDDDGTVRTVRVDAVEEGRSVAWRWWADGDEEAATEVIVTLDPTDEGTRVYVVEQVVAPDGARARASTAPSASSARGWSSRLVLLELLALTTATTALV
jgi:uncharacterized protein YndB with AHSA1/START domain